MLADEGLQVVTGANGQQCTIPQGADSFTLDTVSNPQCELECLTGWYRDDQSQAVPNVACNRDNDKRSSRGDPIYYDKCKRACVVWVSQRYWLSYP